MPSSVLFKQYSNMKLTVILPIGTLLQMRSAKTWKCSIKAELHILSKVLWPKYQLFRFCQEDKPLEAS